MLLTNQGEDWQADRWMDMGMDVMAPRLEKWQETHVSERGRPKNLKDKTWQDRTSDKAGGDQYQARG
jgi:hypothetical protein